MKDKWLKAELSRDKEKRKAWRIAWLAKPETQKRLKVLRKKSKDKNREKNKYKFKEYYLRTNEEYKKRINKRRKERHDTDPQYAIKHNLRSRIHHAVSAQSTKKLDRSSNLLGCTPRELKHYLEARFKPGMSWGNYAFNGWHIDHIRPCSSFDLTIVDEQRKCFHYTNLQPLWWHENLAKSDKYNEQPT